MNGTDVNQTRYDAVVVGGGLVGAAAAVALAQQGHQVLLLERQPPRLDEARLLQGWDARIYALSPGNRNWLRSLGAWPDETRIQPVSRMDVAGDHGGRIVFDADEMGVPALNYMLENRWLLAALWRRLAALPVTVHYGTAAQLHTEADQALLTLSDGTQWRSRLIIGADGATSWVRRAAGIDSLDQAYGHSGVVANFAAEHPHQATAFQWFREGEVLAWLPLPNQQVSMVWSTSRPQRLTALAADELAHTVAAAGGTRLGRLQALSPAFAFELVLRRPQTTVAQRVLLLGDAAHTVHPLAGQGVNLGFGDVQCLAGLVAGHRDIGAWPLLQQYRQLRLLPVRCMQQGCDGLFKLFAEQYVPGAAWLRNRGMSMVNDAAWLKRRLMREAMGL